MSTHCTISMKQSDGSIIGIYVHNDGYPDWMGDILLRNYNTSEKVDELISLGDASIIYPNLNPDFNAVHSCENRQKDISVFYHRDRGEKWKNTKPHKCSSEQYADVFRESYNYIFVDGKWFMSNTERWKSGSDEERLVPLESIVNEE